MSCLLLMLSSPDKIIEIWSIFCGAASRKHSNILTRATSLSSLTSRTNHFLCSTRLFCISARLHLSVYIRVFQYLCIKKSFSLQLVIFEVVRHTHRNTIGKMMTDQKISKGFNLLAPSCRSSQ